MIGVSGCFGGGKPNWPVDDIGEAAAAVDDIAASASRSTVQPEGHDGCQQADLMMAQLVGLYVRRVRLLTWAVAAIVAYLLIKELTD